MFSKGFLDVGFFVSLFDWPRTRATLAMMCANVTRVHVVGWGEQVLSDASAALAMATVEGRLMGSNSRFKSLSGYGDEELKQLTLLKLTAPPDLKETFE